MQSANTGGVGRGTVNETRKLFAPSSPVDSNNMSGGHNVNDCENAANGLNILGGSDNGGGIQVGITLSYSCVLLMIIGCYYVAQNSSAQSLVQSACFFKLHFVVCIPKPKP